MNYLQVFSFLFFIGLVAVITYRKTRNDDVQSKTGYFLANRSLTAPVIAGTLLLTNLSTEQLVGQSGMAYGSGLIVIAWESIAAIALIALALFFLPKYLKLGIPTISDFIEQRYDKTTRIIIDVCLLIATGICFLPIFLYSGALGLNTLFNVPAILGVTDIQALWITSTGIGIIGAIYAIFGGLRAVAISDTINGVGLFIGGLLIPIFGLAVLGHGYVLDGILTLTKNHAEKLNVIGSSDSILPIGSVITGMVLINLFYWCTNQGIIQRALGAKSLVEGQKGVLLTAMFKLFGPIILVLPGVIAFHLYPNLANSDLAYPELVAHVLPPYLSGFFGAVLFGAILSSFNSFLNSAATLFSLGIYNRIIDEKASEAKLITVGKYFGIILTLVSICVAPLIANAPHGLFQWMKQLNGIYNGPMLTIIIIGILFRKVPVIAAKVAMGFGIISYIYVKYIADIQLSFIYVIAIVFAINVVIMLAFGYFKPLAKPFEFKHSLEVDIHPWHKAKTYAAAIFCFLLFIYASLATFGGYHTKLIAILCLIATVVFTVIAYMKKDKTLIEGKQAKVH